MSGEITVKSIEKSLQFWYYVRSMQKPQPLPVFFGLHSSDFRGFSVPPGLRKKQGESMNRKEDLIAVFDSGVGGISVLRHLVRLLPGERFLYYGDSANAPYGPRSREAVEALTMEAAEALVDRGLKALVVACNTATSAAISSLRRRWPELIIIGIEPALKLAVDTFPRGRIGVMATEMTLREEKFSRLLDRYGDEHTICKLPAPGLVELVEAGKGNSPEAEQLLTELLGPYQGSLDALVLGCTHYPFAAGAIAHVLGPRTALLDGGEGTARETRRRLREAGLLEQGRGQIFLENSSGDPGLIALSKTLLSE